MEKIVIQRDEQQEKKATDEQEETRSGVVPPTTEDGGGGPTQLMTKGKNDTINENSNDVSDRTSIRSKNDQEGGTHSCIENSSSSTEKASELSIKETDNSSNKDEETLTTAPKSPLLVASQPKKEQTTDSTAVSNASTKIDNPSQTNNEKMASPKQDTKNNESSAGSSMENDDGGGTVSAQVKAATPNKPQKVKVHFVAVGSAPLMKKAKFLISPKESFSRLQEKLTKMLQLKDSSSPNNKTKSTNHLFLYLHQSFVPSPEDLIGDLNDLFCVRGELILHYSLQEAWG